MADNVYVIDQLVANGNTVTVPDDGSGIDWLVYAGVYEEETSINLNWKYGSNGAYEAAGMYFTGNHVGSRLIVQGTIENARGSNGSDDIQGNELANILYGDNAATGPGGDDVLFGGEGNDTIYGGAGNDQIDGAEDDDRLFGNDGNDSISGGAGVDWIEGGAGADDMTGGSDSGDTVAYTTSNAGVRIDITFGSTTTGRGGHANGDKIGGFTDVVGSKFNDVITDTTKGTISFGYNANTFDGGAGNDKLVLGGGNDFGIGGTGKDILIGELGADRLTGGAGADKFVYLDLADSTVAVAGRDTITDFKSGQRDRIDLAAIDADADRGGNQRFDFIGDDRFSRDAGELRYQKTGNGVIVSGDVDGDGRADFSILVQSVSQLKVGDFML